MLPRELAPRSLLQTLQENTGIEQITIDVDPSQLSDAVKNKVCEVKTFFDQ